MLTVAEKTRIAENLALLDAKIADRKKELAALYDSSVELYNAGQFDKAREGFVKVASAGLLESRQGISAEDYLLKINAAMIAQAKLPPPVDDGTKPVISAFESQLIEQVAGADVKTAELLPTQQSDVPASLDAAGQLTDRNNVTFEPPVSCKEKLIRSYANAVVKDAMKSVENNIVEGKFYWAKKALQEAGDDLSKNRGYIGEQLFNKYMDDLQRLNQEIIAGRACWLGKSAVITD